MKNSEIQPRNEYAIVKISLLHNDYRNIDSANSNRLKRSQLVIRVKIRLFDPTIQLLQNSTERKLT